MAIHFPLRLLKKPAVNMMLTGRKYSAAHAHGMVPLLRRLSPGKSSQDLGMAKIVFYEKPGCINGEKQKTILRSQGHELECRNILEENWSEESLMKFIKTKQPSQFMNHTAPAVKKGEVVPADLSVEEAVRMMIDEPILIKRPLIMVDGRYIQAFDNPELKTYLGTWDGTEDVITCPNLKTVSCDEKSQQG